MPVIQGSDLEALRRAIDHMRAGQASMFSGQDLDHLRRYVDGQRGDPPTAGVDVGKGLRDDLKPYGGGIQYDPPLDKPSGAEADVAGDPPAKRSRRSRRGRVSSLGGHRVVKYWELTSGELSELSELNTRAALSYSIASFAAAFAVDITLNLAFAAAVPETTSAIWHTLRICAAIVVLASAFNGVRLMRRHGTRLQEIKDEHDHD